MNSVTNLDLQKVKEVLEEIFYPDKITDLHFFKGGNVNTLISFQANSDPYILKALTRKPAQRSEFYRLEKEAKLFDYFNRESEQQQFHGTKKGKVPVPEVIHLETNEELLGAKFEILSRISGKLWKECWNYLTYKKKEQLVVELAKILQGVHSQKYELFGEIEEYDCPRRFFSYESFLKANLRRNIRILRNEKRLSSDLLTQSERFIEENLEQANFTTEPTLVHADINEANLIVQEQNKGEWSINGLLDFEWAYAGDPITDLFEIEELIKEKTLQETFFKHYSQDQHFQLENYQIEKRIISITASLESAAIGWIRFHPTEENLEYVTKQLQKNIQ
ncbi:MAG: phosphotransferase [Candidatus Heimdallarchaeota archaeon]|nr:phosphotransferase [Candidatus Heimdallarchaeota archaeon]